MLKNSKIVITGSKGFIGRNLKLRLSEAGYSGVVSFDRENDFDDLPAVLSGASFIFHLAGVNRPDDTAEFVTGNVGLTQNIVDCLNSISESPPILLTSSVQATSNNPYGNSKFAAEEIIASYSMRFPDKGMVMRLPNVFGKWCKPNYNSVVATFCHNIISEIPIEINDSDVDLELVYIDDVCTKLIACMEREDIAGIDLEVLPKYHSTVGELADTIRRFKESRSSLITSNVGTGLQRALHATYLSYLPTEKFTYTIPSHKDDRGEFLEILKTESSGQFSFFTARPGITRGGHYHHSKTEKFLVVSGSAKFMFRHAISNEKYEKYTSSENYEIVETVPGWVHNITNVGDSDLVVFLWANELFDSENPDTIAAEL